MTTITIAAFRLRHPYITISATGTDPDETDFAEWITWSEGKILSYLQVAALPNDIGGIIVNVQDDLLLRKYIIEKTTPDVTPYDVLDQPLPELTSQNKADLDSLKGQDESIEAPAFNFDLDTVEGGFD